ncbi:MAG: winged helix-turn-helix transcriptional regulator [Candidatus Methanospirare jalkutatii]|nr:winged helix-turn-helix transcriptional regulator [Candidatus Methanospirare jalkutatii]MCW7078068.1 winged helix-turn-helix transcriptional regulator [Candidatus Methanoxibalbensis ujae]
MRWTRAGGKAKAMRIEGKTAFVMALFIVAVFMLASKFMLPTTVQVIIEGESTYVKEIPNVYTLLDCVIIAVASFMLGASAFYLLFLGFTDTEKEKEREKMEHGAEQKESSLESLFKNADTHTVQIPEKSSAEDEAGLLKILKGNEKKVIEALMEYGEMNQADLSARTGIPKSTLSRILRDLEDRGLVFRYDYGMSKMVKMGKMVNLANVQMQIKMK